jgi:hypothetical protein
VISSVRRCLNTWYRDINEHGDVDVASGFYRRVNECVTLVGAQCVAFTYGTRDENTVSAGRFLSSDKLRDTIRLDTIA